jgi:hypothetical protein
VIGSSQGFRASDDRKSAFIPTHLSDRIIRLNMLSGGAAPEQHNRGARLDQAGLIKLRGRSRNSSTFIAGTADLWLTSIVG